MPRSHWPKIAFPVVFVAFFALAVLLLGGASRVDSMAQIPVGIVSGLMIGVGVATLRQGALTPYRLPLFLLTFCSLFVALQLVPLPPSIWGTLPGHELYLEGAEIAGIPQPWRPVSISPDLTWAALLGFLTPIAAVFAIAIVGRERSAILVPLLLSAGIAEIVLGLAQLGGGASSPLRYYAITNPDAPVGFFSNRNHFAFFLATMIPLLAVWARGGSNKPDRSRKTTVQQMLLRPALAVACLAMLVPMILLSGSRAGMGLAVAVLVPSLLLFLDGRKVRFDRRTFAYVLSGAGILVATVVATIFAARATAVARLVEADPTGDMRSLYVRPSVELIDAFFPFGSGMGTFDPAFRRFEPFEILSHKYANHAHNELLELPIEGGLVAILLMILLAGWWVARSWQIWRPARARQSDDLAKLGSLIVGVLLAASTVDYPLRTPFMAAFFVVGATWMMAREKLGEAHQE